MKLNIDKLKSNLYPNFEFDINKYNQGGGLSRRKDYKSKEKPYPSVDKKDFAGRDRSYPIPSKEDAVDALRLAGLHGRGDVKAKVYKKYPELKKHQEGGLLERKGVPFVTSKPIQPEFPYNGQSMYKGGYNLKRALELYKPDNTGHLPSVDSETGEWLKDKDYPTSWKELIQTTLNLNLNKQVGFPILNTNGRLQYINKNNK